MNPFMNFNVLDLLSKDELAQLSPAEQSELKKRLQLKLEEYLTIKLSDDLNEKELEEVLDCITFEKRLTVMKKYIPELNEKMENYLENFKQQFKGQE